MNACIYIVIGCLSVDVCSKFLNDKKSKHFNNVSTQHLKQSTKALGGGLKSDQWEGGLGKVMVWGVDQGMVGEYISSTRDEACAIMNV